MSSSLDISDPLMGALLFSSSLSPHSLFSEHHKVYLANVLYQLYLTKFDIIVKQALWKGCDSSAEPLFMRALSQASHMMMLVSRMSTIQILFCCPLVVICTCSSITRFTKEPRYACPHLTSFFISGEWVLLLMAPQWLWMVPWSRQPPFSLILCWSILTQLSVCCFNILWRVLFPLCHLYKWIAFAFL